MDTSTADRLLRLAYAYYRRDRELLALERELEDLRVAHAEFVAAIERALSHDEWDYIPYPAAPVLETPPRRMDRLSPRGYSIAAAQRLSPHYVTHTHQHYATPRHISYAEPLTRVEEEDLAEEIVDELTMVLNTIKFDDYVSQGRGSVSPRYTSPFR